MRSLWALSSRTLRIGKNIAWLLVFRVLGTLANLILVPIALAYVGSEGYGIWVTLFAILTSLGFLDLGLGNGLRNAFAESQLKGDAQETKAIVSSAYFVVGGLSGLFGLVFILVNPLLDWAALLNAPLGMRAELSLLAQIVVLLTCIRVSLSLIGPILLGDQRAALTGGLETAGALLAVAAVVLLDRFTSASIYMLGIAVTLAPILVLLGANAFFFSRRYRRFTPSVRFVRIDRARALLETGARFFGIAIAGTLTISASSLVVAHLFGPEGVTLYSIASKYFGVAGFGFGIVLVPFWNAYTEAFSTGETAWIRRSVRWLIRLWLGGCGVLVIMILVSDYVYRAWIGDRIDIPLSLSVAFAGYVAISGWNNIFASFINGVGRIQLQLYHAILVAMAYVPLAILLSRSAGMGIAGVVVAGSVLLFLGSLWAPLQYRRIVEGQAAGIWAR